jgi:hypothetical protein
MLVSVSANLTMLGWFKYGEFLLANFQTLAAAVGVHYQAPHFDIVLPVGISFYTFATMSYTLDVYLRRSKPTPSMLDFMLFVTFFPHLVAGPIMRPTELVPQFQNVVRLNVDQLRFGLALMTLGLFQKVVLADGFLAGPAEQLFDGTRVPGVLDAWMGTLAFSGQIFCDFAGYSTTAIGAALCLGFKMPDNFRFPYAAVGFSDFWRRWHITLSSWLRDYLYIPLGGNRHGERTYFALMMTMLLGGLWHGANWTFVVWGAAWHVPGCGAMAAHALRVLHTRPRRLHDAGCAHLRTRQRDVGVLPRKDFREGMGRSEGHVRAECGHRAHPRGSAPDRGERDHWRNRVRALAHARADSGVSCRSDTRPDDRSGLVDHAFLSHRRAGDRQCIHLLPVLIGPIASIE